MGLIIAPHRRWTAPPNYPYGIVGSLGLEGEHIERHHPNMMPSEWPSGIVTVASDYGGGQNSDFDSYSFLLAGDGVIEFQYRMTRVRERILTDGRSISFKDRKDNKQQLAEPAFLDAANRIPGVLATVLVDRTKKATIFGAKDDVLAHGPDAVKTLFSKLKPAVFEKLMRVAVFGTSLVAGLSRASQRLFWITDNDDIVANKKTVELFGRSVGALRREMQNDAELPVGITSPMGWSTPAKKLALEDLLAIADYAAGVLPAAVTAWRRAGYKLGSPLVQLLSDAVPGDIRDLVRWFGDDRWPLKRWVFVTTPVNSKEYSFGSLRIGRYAAPLG